ncbi:MAG: hypothetical protein ACI9WU_002977 [Myxococcota bacterium]|jgi:hypothetical protein
MSVFDGSHSFLFDMRLDRPGQISGIFYSGNWWQESFVAERVDQDFALVDPNCHDAAQLIGELKREFGAKGLEFLEWLLSTPTTRRAVGGRSSDSTRAMGWTGMW